MRSVVAPLSRVDLKVEFDVQIGEKSTLLGAAQGGFPRFPHSKRCPNQISNVVFNVQLGARKVNRGNRLTDAHRRAR